MTYDSTLEAFNRGLTQKQNTQSMKPMLIKIFFSFIINIFFFLFSNTLYHYSNTIMKIDISYISQQSSTKLGQNNIYSSCNNYIHQTICKERFRQQEHFQKNHAIYPSIFKNQLPRQDRQSAPNIIVHPRYSKRSKRKKC